MEGLIPFVYRAIVQYKSGGQAAAGTWFCESPSSSSVSYMRLPGDSGRFLASEIQLFRPDNVFSSTTSSSSPSIAASASSTSSVLQSPLCRSTSRRLTVS